MSTITLYRCIASSKLQDWVHVGSMPASREDLLSGMVPIDEFFEGEYPPLTQTMIDAACIRAAKQAAAMRGIDFEYQFLQENAA